MSTKLRLAPPGRNGPKVVEPLFKDGYSLHKQRDGSWKVAHEKNVVGQFKSLEEALTAAYR